MMRVNRGLSPAGAGLLACALLLCLGCDIQDEWIVHVDPNWSLQELVERGASVMFVGAHPDDESVAGAFLAMTCKCLGNPCHMVVLTRGEGGTCYAPPCLPDMGTVRTLEMEEAARRYGSGLELHTFTNFPNPVPPPEDVLEHWYGEGDPTAVIAEAIRTFRPDVVITFDPSVGFTGHPEHRLTGDLVPEAIRLAGDPSFPGEGNPPFRPARLYNVLNRYWFMLPVGWDEGPVNETFFVKQPCPGSEKTCLQEALDAASAHESQWTWILGFAALGFVGEEMMLKRTDL